jgi:hypothetical protein
MVGCKIINRRIDSKSTVASSYAQIQQLHLQTGSSDIRKFKSGAVLAGIWLGVEYQMSKSLSSNGCDQ